MDEILSGEHEIIILMLYSDKNGSYVIKDHNKEIPEEELFEKLNNSEGNYDLKLISRLITTLPSYRILIMKKFVPKKDKFVYSIRIRYNKAAIEFVTNDENKEEQVAEETTEEVVTVEPVVIEPVKTE